MSLFFKTKQLIIENVKSYLNQVRIDNANYVLQKKLLEADPEIQSLVLSEDETNHYGDSQLDDDGLKAVISSFTLARINYINEILGDNGLISDFGDSNGIFIRSGNQKGFSVNISMPALLSIHNMGIETVRANLEYLPFKNNSIDHILLFETLEHVPNPIMLLNEIGRVCRKNLIISIPYVEKTNIHRFAYDPTRTIQQHHIFEFSPDDFKKVITHTPLKLLDEEKIPAFEPRRSIIDFMIFTLWRVFKERDAFLGCFKFFYMCHLIKETNE